MINKQSNLYTIIYIIVMVVVVGTALALTSLGLHNKQQANADADKMKQILASVRITPPADSILTAFDHYIVEQAVYNSQGEKTGTDAFSVDMAAQAKLPVDERSLPVFTCRLADGQTKYILPLSGNGLWGPIWGYIALDSDGTTVYGAFFAHAGETPGLGAEIEKPAFSSQFAGKHMFVDNDFRPVTVVKAGQHPADNRDYVDAVSGGTITSKGVAAMLDNCLAPYHSFLENLNHAN